MSREFDDLQPLRGEGGPERELLGSAAQDKPAAAVYERTLERVLAAERKRRALRSRRRALGLTLGLGLAAAALWLLRGQAPPPRVVAEPPLVSSPAPAVSSAPAPVSPWAPCVPASIGSGREPLIDDFEDGDTRIPVVDQRAGVWIAYNDGTAKQEPRPGSVFPANRIAGGRGSSHFGLRSSGPKFSKWGGAVAIELNPRRCYDASAYAGVTFWARGHGSLRFNVKMTQIVGVEFGGSCLKDCYDSHGSALSLAREWQRYDVRWDELKQRGFGTAVPFDPRSLYSLEFAFAEGQAFDFWIDDVAFLTK